MERRTFLQAAAAAPLAFATDPHEDLPKDVFAANVGDSGGGNTPALRLGKPYELAWAATYLCSPFASMVTGSIFVVDGAMSLARGPRPAAFTPIREQLGRGPFKGST